MRKQSKWLKSLTVEAVQVAEETFAVFPLTAQSTNGRSYLTLDEAIQQGLAFIPESGSVPEVIIVVKGENPVLVVEGTMVVGGLQNRTVNISLLLEAGEHRIPVSCIERGRWSLRRPRVYREPETPREGETQRERQEEEAEVVMSFRVFPFVSHSWLRQIKTESTVRSYLSEDTPRSDQRRVWSEVDRKLHATRVHSPTDDETTLFMRYFAPIEDLLRQIKPIENQVGALVAIGQRIVGLEVFDHPQTWQAMHRKILSGYAADALEVLEFGRRGISVTPDDAKAFLETVASAINKAHVKPSPVGLGEHYLLSGDETLGVGGFALVYEGTMLHLFAYPSDSIRR